MTCLLCVKMVRAHHVVKNPEPMSLKSLATGFHFIFAQRLILGMITLDMFAVFLGGATALLPVFAGNEHLLNAGAGGLGLLQAALPLGSVMCALYLAHRAPMQKAGALAALVRGGVRAGDDCVRAVALVLVFVRNAVRVRRGGQRERRRAAHVRAIAHAGRQARARLVGQQPVHRHIERTGRLRVRLCRASGRPDAAPRHRQPGVIQAVAAGSIFSVVSGGIGTILVVLIVAWLWPEIRRYGKLA